jgi:hypothetical protein
MARLRTIRAAGQLTLVAGRIQLIEVKVPLRGSERTGYVVHSQCDRLARGCGIPKVFFSDRFDELSALAGDAGLRLEVVTTIAR